MSSSGADPAEPDGPAPPDALVVLEEDGVPVPRKAGVADPVRARDLRLTVFGCALLLVSLLALGWAGFDGLLRLLRS